MTAWAKLRKTSEGIALHSLVAHSADAGAVMGRLLAVPIIAERLARLAGLKELDPVSRARLSLLTAIHDVGKANRGFWNRKALQEVSAFSAVGFIKAGHIGPVVDVMHERNVDSCRDKPKSFRLFVDALNLDRLFAWTGARGTEGRRHLTPILNAVLMHHGSLPDCGNIDPKLWVSEDGYDPAEELNRIGAALDIWFPEAFTADALQLPSEERFLHAFAGLVMLADWIASDDRYFAFEPSSGPERIHYARMKAEEAIGHFGLDPLSARAALDSVPDLVTPIIGQGRTPRPVQIAISQTIAETGSTVVIEAETGSGKTEAALLHFINLFKAKQVDGLYFALPTRAAAVQIHRRISEALKKLLGDAAPTVILAVPGYLRADDKDGQKLPEFTVQWPDDMNDLKRDSAWAAEHPKRFLAAAVAVGTVDQLMLGALNVRHAHLRSAPMLRLLLVIDEVHASDIYIERVIRHLLEQHRKAGGHALLMSATLGAATRMRLMGAKPRDTQRLPPIGELAALPYPFIHTACAQVPELPPPPGTMKEIDVELIDVENANHMLAERAMAAALSGARVLVIRNKVDDARETAIYISEMAATQGRSEIAFRCRGIATVHHGRFAPTDRRLLDEGLEQALGAASTEAVVCVTTQTAEQSLDIDADLLLTDICPADVLLQRFGRLHRHARPHRPAGFQRPRAIVLAPSETRLAGMLDRKGEVKGRLLGLGKVYPNLLGIASTRRTLEALGTIRIPEHSRLLVERATHTPFLGTLAGELGGAWGQHHGKITAIGYAQLGIASLNLLDFEKSIAPSIDLDAKIKTRLGADNRAVKFEPPVRGPFGVFIEDLILPGWMAQGTDLEAVAIVTEIRTDGFSFMLDKLKFEYSRWGISTMR